MGMVAMVMATDEERVDARAAELPAESVLERFDPGEFTQLLNATRTGDRSSWGFLLQLVYADLRKLARHHVMAVADASTLGATGLVNECYLRLVGPGRATIENRRHFLNLASRVMRQVLCDYAREQLTEKRGGLQKREDLAVVDAEEWAETERLVMIDDTLRALERENARLARVFECRYFAGLTDDETAETLGLSLRTVQRDWQQARTWLAQRLA
jgi:RNA polymerase sigma factor (TIGR02999 family)